MMLHLQEEKLVSRTWVCGTTRWSRHSFSTQTTSIWRLNSDLMDNIFYSCLTEQEMLSSIVFLWTTKVRFRLILTVGLGWPEYPSHTSRQGSTNSTRTPSMALLATESTRLCTKYPDRNQTSTGFTSFKISHFQSQLISQMFGNWRSKKLKFRKSAH